MKGILWNNPDLGGMDDCTQTDLSVYSAPLLCSVAATGARATQQSKNTSRRKGVAPHVPFCMSHCLGQCSGSHPPRESWFPPPPPYFCFFGKCHFIIVMVVYRLQQLQVGQGNAQRGRLGSSLASHSKQHDLFFLLKKKLMCCLKHWWMSYAWWLGEGRGDLPKLPVFVMVN